MAEAAKDTVLNLMKQKSEIEEKIKEKGEILKKNGVGMNDPLVDEEGFPLSHVNLYEVRYARRDIICLQNDYKAIMKQIENGLSNYYSTTADMPTSSRTEHLEVACEEDHTVPFAKITSVSPNSPADEAGFKTGDSILKFGSINAKNFKDLSTVANVVKHSINKNITVQIIRTSNKLTLSLKPHTWNGPGLLGCVINPVDIIDR